MHPAKGPVKCQTEILTSGCQAGSRKYIPLGNVKILRGEIAADRQLAKTRMYCEYDLVPAKTGFTSGLIRIMCIILAGKQRERERDS